MQRAYYSASISDFLGHSSDEILGALSRASTHPIDLAQKSAWLVQIEILKEVLPRTAFFGRIFFEFVVPRLGKRIDTVVLTPDLLFVLEFKVGETEFAPSNIDQVWDYALDLKNFHQTSHDKVIIPVLIATGANVSDLQIRRSSVDDGVVVPLKASRDTLLDAFTRASAEGVSRSIQVNEWEGGRYSPTPTIIEAATALYAGHGVEAIARSGAEENLERTARVVDEVIEHCRAQSRKAICFITGVPGAGKTLAGLNVATRHIRPGELHSVFLSGNGPLVAILREALARDQVERAALAGEKITKSTANTRVKAFIQNVHHFRDEGLVDPGPPDDHIVVFDEAQRAWNLAQTSAFMQRKKGQPGFAMSEPEFLISCMDRHKDWAVIVCLVGGGQEINTGEAGIVEWLRAASARFAHWAIHISPELAGEEYGGSALPTELAKLPQVFTHPALHLSVSMRSFKAKHVSSFVKQLLDLNVPGARDTFRQLRDDYPIVLCRSVSQARRWLRGQARGSERYGIMVSSQAQRLRPHAIDVRAPVDPVHWFLDGKDDVRSSFYLEDVVTEFQVQGLELDWSCVVWDGDFRHSAGSWQHCSFVGSRWQQIRMAERRAYQKNAYRVLLTRARQGMVIVVPKGDAADPTRDPTFYDGTFSYLQDLGIPVIESRDECSCAADSAVSALSLRSSTATPLERAS